MLVYLGSLCDADHGTHAGDPAVALSKDGVHNAGRGKWATQDAYSVLAGEVIRNNLSTRVTVPNFLSAARQEWKRGRRVARN